MQFLNSNFKIGLKHFGAFQQYIFILLDITNCLRMLKIFLF